VKKTNYKTSSKGRISGPPQAQSGLGKLRIEFSKVQNCLEQVFCLDNLHLKTSNFKTSNYGRSFWSGNCTGLSGGRMEVLERLQAHELYPKSAVVDSALAGDAGE
jgi:hypothetical protein